MENLCQKIQYIEVFDVVLALNYFQAKIWTVPRCHCWRRKWQFCFLLILFSIHIVFRKVTIVQKCAPEL